MILTWLWKMLQWARQSHAAPLLEAPKGPGRLGDVDGNFINTSNDANNSRVVIFEGDETPPETKPAA